MIAKLSKGGSFSGAVQYIFGPGKGANCLAGMGVLFKDTPSIIRGFERQAAQNPKVSKPVGHVVLSFSPRDAARLNNRLLLSIAVEYLDRMGIKDTQYHRPPPRPGTSPPAYSLQPRGQQQTDNLRPQRPLPFGAALQATDRPLRALLCIGQGTGQGVSDARRHLRRAGGSCLPKTATRSTVRRSTGSSAIRKSMPHWNGTADRRLLPNANRLRP